MIRKLLLIIFLLIPSYAYSAELLVRATGHWMDKLTQEEVDKMSDGERESYSARSQKGDIIVVRPDGWTWGKEECLPNYIVVKVPDIKEADAKKFEEPLTETVSETVDGKSVEKQKILRVRKHNILAGQITSAVDAKSSAVTFTKSGIEAVTNIKSGLSSEVVAPSKDKIAYIKRKVEPYIAIAYNFYAKNAYAATQLKKTVKPSGGDYTSLEACMSGNEQDLKAADKYFDVEIDGDWSSGADTTAVTIHNYVIDATRYINIYTTATARHDGKYNTAKYRIEQSNAGVRAISIANSFITISGLQVYQTSTDYTSTSNNCVIDGDGGFSSGVIFNKCIFRGGRYCVNITFYQDFYLYNCVMYTLGIGGAVTNTGAGGTLTLLNCVARGETYGIRNVNGSISVTNTYASGSSGNSFSGTITQTTNASSDSTATGTALDNIPYTTSTFTNVTSGSEDFHLVVGSALIDVGTDLSGTFTDDIDGVTRTGTWDIGADEYVSAGGVDDTSYYIL